MRGSAARVGELVTFERRSTMYRAWMTVGLMVRLWQRPVPALLVVLLVAVITGLAVWSVTRPPAQEPQQQGRPAPTYANVAYGEHERHVLDFYRAESDSPTPLVVWIPGGGFRRGSKDDVDDERGVPAYWPASEAPFAIPRWTAGTLRQLLDAGISVAAINYRYVTTTPVIPGAFYDSRRALQFLRSQAPEWNIDKNRVGAFGSSAGAQIGMYLAFHDEMANPHASDPIARESTRLAAVSTNGGQTTGDDDWWEQWIPEYTNTSQSDPLEFWGVSSQPVLDEKVREVSALANISADDPPIFMSYNMAPDAPVPEGSVANSWKVHHVIFGLKLKEKTDQLGVEADLKYPGVTSKYQNTAQFFIEKLGRH